MKMLAWLLGCIAIFGSIVLVLIAVGPRQTPAVYALLTVIWSVVLSVAGAIYLIPTYVAKRRDARNRTGLILLNLIFGWTGVGWIGSLIWALSAETEEQAKRKEIDYEMLARLRGTEDFQRNAPESAE